MSVRWNPPGNAALVIAAAAHDNTGASYYGAASLYLLLADATVPAVAVCSAGSDGHVHDAQWNPDATRKEFAVISGRRAIIYNAKTCKPVLDFGSAGWNTVGHIPHTHKLHYS